MLKSILTILTVLIISTCIHTSTSTPTKCRNKNPFLQSIKKPRRGTGPIFEVPEISNRSVCGTEWKEHGTCCEYSWLKKYAKDDRGNTTVYVKNLQKEVELSVLSLTIFRLQIVQMKEELRSTGSLGAFKNLSATDQNSHVQYLQKWDTMLSSLIRKVDKLEGNFEKQQLTCGKEIAKIRSNSLCSVCSGRSEIFFVSQKILPKIQNGTKKRSRKRPFYKKKAVIHPDTCKHFVSKCFDSWVSLTNILSTIKSVENFVGKIKAQYNLTHSYLYSGPLLNKITDWINNAGIKSQVNKCKNRFDGCDTETLANLCESTLSLHKPTYLKSTITYLIKSRKILNVKDVKLQNKIVHRLEQLHKQFPQNKLVEVYLRSSQLMLRIYNNSVEVEQKWKDNEEYKKFLKRPRKIRQCKELKNMWAVVGRLTEELNKTNATSTEPRKLFADLSLTSNAAILPTSTTGFSNPNISPQIMPNSNPLFPSLQAANNLFNSFPSPLPQSVGSPALLETPPPLGVTPAGQSLTDITVVPQCQFTNTLQPIIADIKFN